MLEWLIKNCPRSAIVRALEANKVEFLGGFNLVPPSDLPGWIFKTRTKNVCILCNDKKHKYEIRIVKRIPWEHWHGVFHGILMIDNLNSGDNPLLYKELHDAAKSNRPPEDS